MDFTGSLARPTHTMKSPSIFWKKNAPPPPPPHTHTHNPHPFWYLQRVCSKAIFVQFLHRSVEPVILRIFAYFLYVCGGPLRMWFCFIFFFSRFGRSINILIFGQYFSCLWGECITAIFISCGALYWLFLLKFFDFYSLVSYFCVPVAF